MYWLEFTISALVIIAAGSRLTIYADRLSDQLNLGKALVGIVLLGLITSLPEAVACVVSIRSLNADNMAVGNLLGSNNFNPLFIVVMDLVYRKGPISNQVHPNATHKLSAYYVLILTAVVIFEIVFSSFPHIGPLSLGGLAIVWIYISGIRNLASIAAPMDDVPNKEVKGTLTNTWMNLFVCAAFVVVAAVWLANSADKIAIETGLGRTFVGSIFLALATSLPEMVVSLSALRMGALDLAIGNIFGSNMSNMFILFLCSLVNPEGPILFDVDKTHIITALSSMLMVFIAIQGIRQNQKKAFAGLGWDSWAMMFVFFSGSSLLYIFK